MFLAVFGRPGRKRTQKASLNAQKARRRTTPERSAEGAPERAEGADADRVAGTEGALEPRRRREMTDRDGRRKRP